MSVHADLKRGQQIVGIGGAVVGIGVGLWGATRRRVGAEIAPRAVRFAELATLDAISE
jgi:hypothetical protein